MIELSTPYKWYCYVRECLSLLVHTRSLKRAVSVQMQLASIHPALWLLTRDNFVRHLKSYCPQDKPSLSPFSFAFRTLKSAVKVYFEFLHRAPTCLSRNFNRQKIVKMPSRDSRQLHISPSKKEKWYAYYITENQHQSSRTHSIVTISYQRVFEKRKRIEIAVTVGNWLFFARFAVKWVLTVSKVSLAADRIHEDVWLKCLVSLASRHAIVSRLGKSQWPRAQCVRICRVRDIGEERASYSTVNLKHPIASHARGYRKLLGYDPYRSADSSVISPVLTVLGRPCRRSSLITAVCSRWMSWWSRSANNGGCSQERQIYGALPFYWTLHHISFYHPAEFPDSSLATAGTINYARCYL